MDCALTCILVLVVYLQHAVVNLHRNFNNLIRFYELIKSNVSVYELQSLSRIPFVSQIFVVARPEMGPMRTISSQL
jgi:hypothetical protein